jgi:hypothetical protein
LNLRIDQNTIFSANWIWRESPRRPLTHMVMRSSPWGLSFITVAPSASAIQNIVFSVDGYTVRLLLVTDYLIADLQNQSVLRVQLIELRASHRLALKDP